MHSHDLKHGSKRGTSGATVCDTQAWWKRSTANDSLAADTCITEAAAEGPPE